MDLGRLAFRSLLLLAVAALAAGCATNAPPAESGDGNGPADDASGSATGCIEEGRTGSGNGDVVADAACSEGTGAGNQTLP